MDHQVRLVRERGLERTRVVREEIVPSTATLDARARRKVEAKVRVREEEDSDDVVHLGNI